MLIMLNFLKLKLKRDYLSSINNNGKLPCMTVLCSFYKTIINNDLCMQQNICQFYYLFREKI